MWYIGVIEYQGSVFSVDYQNKCYDVKIKNGGYKLNFNNCVIIKRN